MPSIIKLAPEVASRIAAGEVVERPFNVVKELMENSADAGAGKITVEIADGGLSFIRITDDGKGIDSDDLPMALERFATSKARNVEDVYRAATFGFRGEALAAVSSVSDFTVTSGTDSGSAFLINSRYGSVGPVKPAAFTRGTVVEAKGLFENVPARRKFLKSGKSLEAETVRFVKYFSLINPGIEASVYVNGKCVYEAFASEDASIRASRVFPGKAFCPGRAEYGGYSAFASATLPADCDRLKRDSIVIGVNGRLIKDPSLTQAVIVAYHRLIPEGRFPAAVLDLRVPPEEVDANVHPSKMEVRFEKSRDVFGLATEAVKKCFEGKGINLDYSAEDEMRKLDPIHVGNLRETPSGVKNGPASVPAAVSDKTAVNTAENRKSIYAFDITDMDAESPLLFPEKQVETTGGASARTEIDVPGRDEGTEISGSLDEDVPGPFEVPSFRIVGQIANAFIVCETEKGEVLFIDQHAAHERILFEKEGRKERKTRASIVLHRPAEGRLTDEQEDAARENRDVLENFGYSFEIGEGGRFAISRVPLSAARKDAEEHFKIIVSELCAEGRSRSKDAPRALLSCKSAIKAGDRLTETEMDHLVNLLFRTENYGTCPHGRPVVYKISVRELAAKFLR